MNTTNRLGTNRCPYCGRPSVGNVRCEQCEIAASGSMFLRGRLVRHKKTGGVYVIVSDLGDKLRIEATNKPAYAYMSVESGKHPTWVRPASEMEDGRFEHVT